MKKIVTLFFLISTLFGSSIQVSGPITTNTDWNVDTVFVTANVTVNDGITLTIQPGTKVISSQNAIMAVQGTILAEGTPTDSITFTAAEPESGWGRFLFNGTAVTNDTSRFSYCVIKYGNTTQLVGVVPYGGAFYINYYSKIVIANSDIHHNNGTNGAIILDNSGIKMFNNKIHHNTSYGTMSTGITNTAVITGNEFYENTTFGVYAGYLDKTYFSNNLIHHNGLGGIFCWNSQATFINNTIADNSGWGIDFNSTSNNMLYNNIIYGHTISEVDLDATSDPNFYYCDIEGGTAAFTGAGAGTEFTGDYENCIDADPMFTMSSEHPYSLIQFSPCMDMGINSIVDFTMPAEDFAGNQRISNDLIDIGAYEYYVRTDTVSGVWTLANSPYYITGNQYIADGTTLTIEPGVEVIFQGWYKIEVQGTIIAEGTEVDSIRFTAEDTDIGWAHIAFNYTPINNDTSSFAYCIIEYGRSFRVQRYPYADGGALLLNNNARVKIAHCSIRYNQGSNTAILIDNSSIIMHDNIIHSNHWSGINMVGGMYTSKVYNNKIYYNTGYGLYTGYSDASIYTGNVIHHNFNGGVFCYASMATFINNTIVDNYYSGMYFWASSVNSLYNNIIYGNPTAQVELQTSSDPDFYYCDIQGGTGAFTGDGAGAEYSGVYENCIDENPMFVNGNYQLEEGSLCIDAGTPDVSGFDLPEYDIAGNARVQNGRIDIGALEGSFPNAVETEKPVIAQFALKQNYPNPFNPVTTIQYSIPITADVELTIFNILGQQIKSFIRSNQTAGAYQFIIDGSNLSSGVYFYKLVANNQLIGQRKMMLVK